MFHPAVITYYIYPNVNLIAAWIADGCLMDN